MAKAIQFPKSLQITQGTIFIGGIAEDYPNSRSLGLIITARCDAANDKVRTYNYLPVVPLDDWLQVDGTQVVCERMRADTQNAMRNALRSAELSTSILETEDPERILTLAFTGDDKKILAARSRFSEALQKWLSLRKISEKAPHGCPFVDLARIDSYPAREMLTRLCRASGEWA